MKLSKLQKTTKDYQVLMGISQMKPKLRVEDNHYDSFDQTD